MTDFLLERRGPGGTWTSLGTVPELHAAEYQRRFASRGGAELAALELSGPVDGLDPYDVRIVEADSRQVVATPELLSGPEMRDRLTALERERALLAELTSARERELRYLRRDLADVEEHLAALRQGGAA